MRILFSLCLFLGTVLLPAPESKRATADNWVSVGYPDGPDYEVSGSTELLGTYGTDVTSVSLEMRFWWGEGPNQYTPLTFGNAYINNNDGTWSFGWDFTTYKPPGCPYVAAVLTCKAGVNDGLGDTVFLSVY